jgi:hypothetical protein
MVVAVAALALFGSSVRAQAPTDAYDAALAAALGSNGVLTAPGQPCTATAPALCVVASTPPRPEDVESAARGVVVFGEGNDQGGAEVVFAVDAGGAWQQWFGFQNIIYEIVQLPGAAFVCAGGDMLNIRAGADPNSPIVGTVSDGASLQLLQFVLTQPSNFTGGTRVVGSGWYRIDTPVAGWVSSLYVSDARLPDCTVHDAQAAAP